MTARSRANYERKVASEHDEQVAVCEYLYRFYPDALFWASANGAPMGGGKIGAIRMNTMKKSGLLPGVSDLQIFEPRGGYSCLFIEMKTENGGNGASENQMHFLREVEKRGGYGIVCNGFIEAQPVIDDYLNGRMLMKTPEQYAEMALRVETRAWVENLRFDWMLAAEYWFLAGNVEKEAECRQKAEKGK